MLPGGPRLIAALAALSLACGGDERPPGLAGGGVASAGANPTASGGASHQGGGGAGEGGSAMAGASGAGGSAGSGGSAGTRSDGLPLEPACIPREGCQRLCSTFGTDPAGCGLGNGAQCGCECEERFNGPCPDELDALVACVGEAPSIDCRARGRIFEGCEDESFALEACDFGAREQLCARAYPACTPYCRAAVLAFCPLGPESAASCLCGCEASLVTTCAAEFDAFMSCSEQAPTFACDLAGRVTASACSAEWQALEACVAG